MGRPKADLAAYSPWGAYPIPLPTAPSPAWLPVVPQAGVLNWSDLAIWALGQPIAQAQVSLFTNFYQPTDTSTLASFTSPTATLACVAGDIDDLCFALTAAQEVPLAALPKSVAVRASFPSPLLMASRTSD